MAMVFGDVVTAASALITSDYIAIIVAGGVVALAGVLLRRLVRGVR